MDPQLLANAALAYPILLFALSFHEWGHAVSAKLFGDRTAEMQGRLTLNPISHIDPVGTVLIPLFQLLSPGYGRFILGWANPVPVDPTRLRKTRDIVWVALAGPACNLVIVVVVVILFKILLVADAIDPTTKAGEVLYNAFLFAVSINLTLFWFNLIPLTPLDGSKVVLAYVPGHSRMMPFWESYERYGFVILMVLLFTNSLHFLLGYPMEMSYRAIQWFLT